MSIQNTTNWLNSIGIKAHLVDNLGSTQSFWPNIVIDQGELYFTGDVHPGFLLHEAGHIAVTPSSHRHHLNSDLNISYASFLAQGLKLIEANPKWQYTSDSAAIAWEYFAAVENGFDRDIFNVGFETPEIGIEIWDILQIGTQSKLGSAYSVELYYAGLIDQKDAKRLTKYLQD